VLAPQVPADVGGELLPESARIQTAPLILAAEAAALGLLVGGATTLSHSRLLAAEDSGLAVGGDWDGLSADCSAAVRDDAVAGAADLVSESHKITAACG
jgi:hypothetical protein